MTVQGNDREWLPLSLAQQTIWLESKLNRDTVLQLGGWARIEGQLDIATVRRAAALVMARHDALRLRVDDEEPRQWLESASIVPLSVVHMEPTDTPDDEFERYIEKVFASPLPFGDRPLFHISVLEYSAELCYMLWRFHHIISDSVSTTAAMRHWTEAYLALTSDEPHELSPRSSYRGLVLADAEYLRSQEYKRDMAYWTKRFDPLPPILINIHLVKQGNVDLRSFYSDLLIVGEDWEQLLRLAEHWEVTAARIVFTLFVLTVADRYQETDLVAGVALHRRDKSTKQALGMFSGILPMRYQFNPMSLLQEAVRGFSSQIDQDLRYQRMPIDDLARALALFRAGRSRLFDLVMSYIPVDRSSGEQLSDGLPITSDVVALPEASPISLHVTELDGGLKIRIAVNPYLLASEEAVSFSLQLKGALERIAASSDLAVKDLFYLTEDHAIVGGSKHQKSEPEEWII